MVDKRDDFDRRTKDILARRVGHKCSLPDCQAQTSGPGDPGDFSNVGVAAHIRAASEGGPRFDPNQTPAQRKSFENGIWACTIHGKHIDDASNTYTVELLERYKLEAEERATQDLGRALPAPRFVAEIVAGVAKGIVEQLREIRDSAYLRRSNSLENFDAQVRSALSDHSGLLESGVATVEALLNEPEFQKIADNYALEAQREALLERARMLAYALAGTLCNGNLTISQKSRVERVIRELDPADALLLYQLSCVSLETVENDGFDRDAMMRMQLLDKQASSRDILHASGCVNWESNGGLDGGVLYAYITTIGEAVLEVLSGYTQICKATSQS